VVTLRHGKIDDGSMRFRASSRRGRGGNIAPFVKICR